MPVETAFAATAVPGCLAAMDRAAVLAMAHTVQLTGLFADGRPHTTPEILTALGAAPRHHWIVRRWLTALTTGGMLEQDPGSGEFRGLRPVSRPELAAAVRELETGRRGLGYPAEMGRFFQTALRILPQLVRDAVGLQSLLFADGGTATADGNYRDNLVSRHINTAAAQAVAAAARSRTNTRPLRVLEIGAGVGATTGAVLHALGTAADTPLDYLFTDVSPFFLDAARERFSHRPELRHGLLDINTPAPWIREEHFDVVLAANVLHNAHHAGRTLEAIHELLAPGGTFVMLESCVEHHLVSVSMHFLMSPRPDGAADGGGGFRDLRQGQDRIFLDRDEWQHYLSAAGFQPPDIRPDPADPIAAAGQFLFTAVRGDASVSPHLPFMEHS